MMTNVLHIIILTLVFFVNPKNALSFCFESAGQTYKIPSKLIEAIASQESAFDSNAIHRNHNGSFDYGVMQINSFWFETLGKNRWQALSDPCFNVMVGAWILRDCINRYGYTWDCLSCYRSGKPLSELKEPVKRDVLHYIERIRSYFEDFYWVQRK